MSVSEIENIPGIVIDDEGPVFNEPWEASAFALAVELHQNGMFEWSEWSETLGALIKEAGDSKTYYEIWLSALETIISQKALIADDDISQRKREWQDALLATPHGKPIELKKHS